MRQSTMLTPQRPAPMDSRATEELNLKVMTRIDSATEEILASAGHVALYDFNMADKTWARKDVEGSLFLQKRSSAPVYQFTILNKKSQCNYSEELSEAFAFEEQNEKYLLYRNVHNEVLCLWFHSADDCAKVSKLFRKVTSGTGLNTSQSAKSAPAASAQNGSTGGGDGFWDKAVPGMQAKQLQSTDAALNGGAAPQAQRPPSAADGPLHKLFSNIKLAPGVTPHQSGPQQPPQQPQPSIPLPPRNQIPRPQRSSAPAQRQPPAPAPQRPSAPAAENGIQQQQQPAAAARSGSGSLPKPASPTSPAPAALGGGPANSGTSGTPSGKAGPPARPPLLTPSFFKQPAPQRDSASSPLPFSFGGASSSQQQTPASGGGGAAGSPEATRAAVRHAVLSLAEQEPFLDMVAAALQDAGFKF